MKGVHDEAPERDVAVYLGLAATAFLLVMLHPSKEDETPKSPATVQPIHLEGVQVWARCNRSRTLPNRGGADASKTLPESTDISLSDTTSHNVQQDPATQLC